MNTFAIVDAGNVVEIVHSRDGIKRSGWFDYEVVKPAFDPQYQYMSGPSYTIAEGVVTAVYTIVDKPITAEIKKKELERLAEKRWQVETSGTEWNGIKIRTDRESRNTLVSAIQSMQRLNVGAVRYKTLSGWVTLTPADTDLILRAVFDHVQNSFLREEQLSIQIQSAVSVNDLRWEW